MQKLNESFQNNQQYEPHTQCFTREEDCYTVDVCKCFDIFLFFRYNGDNFVRSVDANFIVWETYFNATMCQVICIRCVCVLLQKHKTFLWLCRQPAFMRPKHGNLCQLMRSVMKRPGDLMWVQVYLSLVFITWLYLRGYEQSYGLLAMKEEGMCFMSFRNTGAVFFSQL